MSRPVLMPESDAIPDFPRQAVYVYGDLDIYGAPIIDETIIGKNIEIGGKTTATLPMFGFSSGDPSYIDNTDPENVTYGGPIQMQLLALNKMVSIGQLGKVSDTYYNPGFTYYDAIATLNISVDTFRNMFLFQSDGFDVDNNPSQDIRYYTYYDSIPTAEEIKLYNSVIEYGHAEPSAADQHLIKDYVRHLANQLFNTPFATDLFINEQELRDSVQTALNTIWEACKNDLIKVSTKGDYSGHQGNENHYYLTDGETDTETGKPSKTDPLNSPLNIGRELFRMLISRASRRFTNLVDLEVDSDTASKIDPDATKLYHFPFIVGDQIVLRLVLQPNPLQKSFINEAQDKIIRADTRAYIIKINLVTPPP